MATQPESKLQRRIRGALEAKYPTSVWVKYHGGMYTKSGMPDLIGVVEGRYAAFEVKRPEGRVSRIQQRTIARLKRAGAIVAVVTSPKEAIEIVEEAFGRGKCQFVEYLPGDYGRRHCTRGRGHPGIHRMYP